MTKTGLGLRVPLSHKTLVIVFIFSNCSSTASQETLQAWRESWSENLVPLSGYHYFPSHGLWFVPAGNALQCHGQCVLDDYCASFTFLRGLSGQGYCVASRDVPDPADSAKVEVKGAKTYSLRRDWSVVRTTTTATPTSATSTSGEASATTTTTSGETRATTNGAATTTATSTTTTGTAGVPNSSPTTVASTTTSYTYPVYTYKSTACAPSLTCIVGGLVDGIGGLFG